MSRRQPCPHCRALAVAEASTFFRWRCAVCGGPIVPAAAGVTRSGLELPDLVRAQRARAMAFGWFATAILFLSMSMLACGLGLLLWGASHFAALVLGAAAVATGAMALGTRSRGVRRNGEARNALDSAWQSVADETQGDAASYVRVAGEGDSASDADVPPSDAQPAMKRQESP